MGQQVTLTSTNSSAVSSRINLLEQRAGAPFVSKALGGSTTECDLVATVVQAGVAKGYLYDPNSHNFFTSKGTTSISDNALRALATTAGQEVTFSCVPPGSGSGIAFGQ